jgi:hypothetical protein
MGSLDGSMPATPQEIVEATKDVLEDSDIHVLSSGATSVDGTVVGRTDLDRKIEITVKRVATRRARSRSASAPPATRRLAGTSSTGSRRG